MRDRVRCFFAKELGLAHLNSRFSDFTLAPDASIDLHMHTTYSDGRWPAEQLIDYLVNEGFAMVAVTDHDRVDTVAGIQELAAKKNLPVLAGVEMSTEWHGKMGHVLCYGFDPEQNYLSEVTEAHGPTPGHAAGFPKGQFDRTRHGHRRPGCHHGSSLPVPRWQAAESPKKRC